jgi:hypothetical protein
MGHDDKCELNIGALVCGCPKRAYERDPFVLEDGETVRWGQNIQKRKDVC